MERLTSKASVLTKCKDITEYLAQSALAGGNIIEPEFLSNAVRSVKVGGIWEN